MPMRRVLLPVATLTLIVGFLLGLVVAGTRQGGKVDAFVRRPAADTGPAVVAAPPETTRASATVLPGVDFAAIAEHLNGAVVSIDATTRGEASRTRRGSRGSGESDGGARGGSGSGFIIDAAGLILTNYHVVEGADRVSVTLSDGRSFRATVVGTDPAIDIALLRVNAGTAALPVAPIGRSEDLRPGEWVCAIGNPLGYVHSVTVGVVSYLGRKVFDQSLDAFIQTDAAITFGNSGGPLINTQGRVVGITTAVSAQASNIGFAIPISQVLSVLPQLRERGKVSRGYMGVVPTNITATLQRALRLSRAQGALLQDVTADGPAARAGLRAYDVIVGVDGRPVISEDALVREISSRLPGSVAQLDVWRDGATRTVQVKLAERPLPPSRRDAAQTQSGAPGAPGIDPVANSNADPLGLDVRDLDALTSRRLKLPATLGGVVIMDLDAASPTSEAHVRRGQVLLEINRQRILSTADYRRAVSTLHHGDAVALLVFDPLTTQRALYTLVIDQPLP